MSVCVDNFFINWFSPQVLLCFSRDTAVLEHFNYNSATPPKSHIQSNVFECLSLLQSSDIFLSFYPVYKVVFYSGKSGSEQCAVVYPPNGEKTAITNICIIACTSMSQHAPCIDSFVEFSEISMKPNDLLV